MELDFSMQLLFIMMILPLNPMAYSKEIYMGTADYLKGRLPSDLLPFEQLQAKDANGCIAQCSSLNCSSLAFSRMLGKCRLFKHDSLTTPLPPLEKVYHSGFQMFYNVSLELNLYLLKVEFPETILSWRFRTFGWPVFSCSRRNNDQRQGLGIL